MRFTSTIDPFTEQRSPFNILTFSIYSHDQNSKYNFHLMRQGSNFKESMADLKSAAMLLAAKYKSLGPKKS